MVVVIVGMRCGLVSVRTVVVVGMAEVAAVAMAIAAEVLVGDSFSAHRLGG
jgi:hypothetical protein